jgi:hypothetical protein
LTINLLTPALARPFSGEVFRHRFRMEFASAAA